MEFTTTELVSAIVSVFTIGVSIGLFKSKFVSESQCEKCKNKIDTELKDQYAKFYSSLLRIHEKIDNIEKKLNEVKV